MLSRVEMRAGLSGIAVLLQFKLGYEARFPADRPAALRTFWLLLVLFPTFLAGTWLSNAPYLERYHVSLGLYLALHSLGFFVALAGGLWLVKSVAAFEGVETRFYHWLAANNWLSLGVTIALLPLFIGSEGPWLDRDMRVTLGLIQFMLGLAYGWFVAWRFLKVNPFMAAGISILPSMLSTATFDFINHSQFGLARPFFAP